MTYYIPFAAIWPDELPPPRACISCGSPMGDWVEDGPRKRAVCTRAGCGCTTWIEPPTAVN